MSVTYHQKNFRDMPWKNGGGVTTELFRISDPQDGQRFLFRLSVAAVESSGPFSIYEGIDRHLVLLSGNGVRLLRNGHTTLLDLPFKVISFAGEDEIHGDLVSGPCRDFNVMTDRNWGKASVSIKKVAANETISFQTHHELYIYHCEKKNLVRLQDEQWNSTFSDESHLIIVELILL